MYLLRFKDYIQGQKCQHKSKGKMKLNAEIVVKENINDIEKLFCAEEKNFKNQRAGYKIQKSRNKLVFKITAKDSSALRAALNSVTKLINVYEQARKVIK